MDVRSARESRGVSQAELARRVGVAANVVWRWETGKRAPTMRFVERIASALDMSVDELCGQRAAKRRARTAAAAG